MTGDRRGDLRLITRVSLRGGQNALGHSGRIGPREYDTDALVLVRKMKSKGAQLVFVYEAGPCDYWLTAI